MDLKRTYLMPFALLVALVFSPNGHAQDADWTKRKTLNQLEIDFVNLGINSHHQLGKRFSMRFHASAGPHYYWAQDIEPRNGAFFIPYLMAELRWYPGHNVHKDLKWKYSPLDGFYLDFVTSASFWTPKIAKGYPGNSGFPFPLASFGMGYQHRFLKHGFVNFSAQYGLVLERYYYGGYESNTGIGYGPTANFGLGFCIPVNRTE